MAKRRALLVSIALLPILFFLTWEGIRIADRAHRRRAEARRLIGSALLGSKTPTDEAVLFRRARKLDPAHDRSGCERGMALERQGQWALAAEAFHACVAADPDAAFAHYAYAQALFKAYGRKSALDARTELRRFAELAKDPSAPIDPVIQRQAELLTYDLEDLLGQGAPALRKRYTTEEIREILTRSQVRGHSRYGGPRVPLRLAFRPGDTELGAADEEQLREAASALRDRLLAKARIRIEGHSDSVEGGSNEARHDLSQRRSEVVERFLVDRCGIPRSRLSNVGFADKYPLASNETQEGRTANRRVELVNLEEKTPLLRDVRDFH
jgi:outer membrane protein OmpA-like peptidoglycan-associated protein